MLHSRVVQSRLPEPSNSRRYRSPSIPASTDSQAREPEAADTPAVAEEVPWHTLPEHHHKRIRGTAGLADNLTILTGMANCAWKRFEPEPPEQEPPLQRVPYSRLPDLPDPES